MRQCGTLVQQAERNQGQRPGPTTDERERIKALERENRELRQGNEILRKASAYETDTGKLFYDADGNGTGAAVQFAVLSNFASLTGANAISAADFFIV